MGRKKRKILTPSGHIRQLDLLRYLDKDRAIPAEIEEHLIACKDCRSRLKTLIEFDIALEGFLSGEDIRGKIEGLIAKIEEDAKLIEEAIRLCKKGQH